MRIVACILPSGPSSACPTVPRPRIRPSVTPFCLSRPATPTAVIKDAPRVRCRDPHREPRGLISQGIRKVPYLRHPAVIVWTPQRVRAELPFARRGVPLVPDRAPLMAIPPSRVDIGGVRYAVRTGGRRSHPRGVRDLAAAYAGARSLMSPAAYN